jgi:hypothetical protein
MHTTKRSSVLKLLGAAGLVLTLMHCGVEGEKSRQSHIIGQTTYQRTQALASCKTKASSEHPIVRDYIQKIVNHIIEKNPNTFKGPYSPTAFCVQFKTNDPMLGSTSPNASAEPGSGLLTFNPPVVNEVPNDASLAAVIAHELAHVTMDHSRSEPDVVKNNAEMQKLKAEQSKLSKEKEDLMEKSLPQFRSLFQQISIALEDPGLEALKDEVVKELDYLTTSIQDTEAKITAGTAEAWARSSLLDDYGYYFEEFSSLAQSYSQVTVVKTLLADIKIVQDPIDALNTSIRSNRDEQKTLSDQLLGGKNASANWREQEADEVGYELYLRAGLNSSLYTWIHGYFLRQQSGKSEAACETLLEKGEIPDRGRQSHPSSCWRIYDINFLESGLHKKDYEPLLPGATQETLFPGELDDVKAYLKKP